MLKRLLRSLFRSKTRGSTTRRRRGSAESQLAKGAARTLKKKL